MDPQEILLRNGSVFPMRNWSKITGLPVEQVSRMMAGLPTYKMVDTCAAEFPAKHPVFLFHVGTGL